MGNELNVLVVGPAGSGKTSTLRMLAQASKDRPAVYVDLARAATAADALVLIADALSVARSSAIVASVAAMAQPARRAPDAELLNLVHSLRSAPPSLLLLDDPPRGDEGHRLFGRLRDELWQLDHQWVVAATPGSATALERPPANAFFEIRIELGALDDERQRRLLKLRLPGANDDTIDSLIGRVELPRELLALARDTVLEGGSPIEAAARIDAINERLSNLSELEFAIVTYLRSHGGTFSSDPSLLAALEVSQPQAAKLLKRLAGKAVLTPRPERHGQGRPRTVYELAPEYQA